MEREDLVPELVERLHGMARLAMQIMPPEDVATAFVGVGLDLAIADGGKPAVVEWLRDSADRLERQYIANQSVQ